MKKKEPACSEWLPIRDNNLEFDWRLTSNIAVHSKNASTAQVPCVENTKWKRNGVTNRKPCISRSKFMTHKEMFTIEN